MKQIIAIGGISNSVADVDEIKHYANGIQQTVGDKAEVVWTNLDKLYFVMAPGDFRIYDTQNNLMLGDADLVVLRSKMRSYGTLAYCLSKFCKLQGIEHFNDYSFYFNGTKIVQSVIMYEQQVPFLKTVYALDHQVLLEAVKKELSLPFILKDAHGAHGNSNYLIRSYEQAEKVMAEEPDVHFIAQEFCPNDRDYRVFITDDEHLVFARSGGADTHLNNTSKGGAATLANEVLPADILDQAHRLAKAMQLSLAGVDVIQNLESGKYYFLEINSQPQTFTGAFLEEKSVQYKRFIEKHLSLS